MALAAGTKLGPYQIQSTLGAGGMGEVYRARDTRLERTVAIKILPAHLSSNDELKARFEREARAASALNHPHICQLYDIGSQDGTAYLVMEYLEGESLAERLRKGALPLKQALEYGIEITEALAAAHRAGIVHRDLKPGNVMLTEGGAKLLDFGLAKAAPTLGGAAVSAMTPSTPTMTVAELSSAPKGLTQRGTVLGTFQYMAPEVLQGAEADARSDVFSLGCVLYEMVTGRRAFEGKSQLSVLTGILEKDPEPVSRVQEASPKSLDHAVKGCLEKNPEERLQTAHDVKMQLKWVAEGLGQKEAKPGRARPWMAWAAAGLAALVAVGLGAAYLRVATGESAAVRSSILPPAGTVFVTLLPSSGPAVISPDGMRLAFTAQDEKGKVLLYVRGLNSLTPQAVTGTEDAMYPFWSGDSRDIGFFASGKLKKVSASGGPVQELCAATSGRGGAWNKDGVIVFTASVQGPLTRVAATGGKTSPATKLEVARSENSHRWPHFLPDNRHFIYWARNSRGSGEQSLYVGSLDSEQTKLLMTGVTTATYASGYVLFMREQTLMAQAFDTKRLELSGEAEPIAEHVAVNGATGAPEFSASETGRLVYQSGDASGAWDLVWSDRGGKSTAAVAQQERYYFPTLSPDNSQLAVALFNGAQGTADTWILDLKRETRSRLTFGPGTQVPGTWSADGKTVYYQSNEKGRNQMYAKAADGSGSAQLVLDDPGSSDIPSSMSADGRYLVFWRRSVEDPGGTYDLWVLPMFGERKPFPIVQTPFNDTSGRISPSGKWMVYQNNESGRAEIYITPFPGGGARWQVSTNGGVEGQWRGDGKEMYFLDPTDTIMAVDVDPTGSAPRLGVPHALFQATGLQRQVGAYVAAKDGQRFLVNSGSTKHGTEPLTLVMNWIAEVKR